MICQGGYPEIALHADEKQRIRWFDSYLQAIFERDIRDFSAIEHSEQLPAITALLAARNSGILNFSSLANDLNLNQKTLKRYFDLLEMIFIVKRLPAYAQNLRKRVTRSPKLYFLDTGLLTAQLRLTSDSVSPTALGPLLENLVYTELLKQISWLPEKGLRVYYFRTADGTIEVDFLIELPNRQVAAIEVKSSTRYRPSDFKGMEYLQKHLGERFLKGVVLYMGSEAVTHGKDLVAMPISALWSMNRLALPA